MKGLRTVQAKRTITSFGGNSKQSQQQKQQKCTSNSKATNDNSKTTDTICDICAQNVPGPERERIFAFGKCDHHVCYVCSARLRAICDQNECPICREKLDVVLFSSDKTRPFEKHDIANFIYDEKCKIYFETQTIRDAFEKLLKYECLQCLKGDPSPTASKEAAGTDASKLEFPDVLKLRNHLNFTHKLRLCDLCLNHSKLFPFEYSYYDSASLRRHMKDGEPNTSHRGHPDCILCHNTFFNQDELLQHMSREHYHCHLCGRHNSTMHIYFLDYASLRDHFKAAHYLCERGNCKHVEFTSAFDSQIDYQLHVAHTHGGSANASSREARQQRTITLESAPHRVPTHRPQSNIPANAAVVSTGTLATANASDPRRQIPESIQAQIRQQRLPSRSDFPALGHLASDFNGDSLPTSQSISVSSTTSNPIQFPSLVQNAPSKTLRPTTPHYRVTAGPSGSRSGLPSFVRSAGGGGGGPPDQLNEMDFPPLPEQPKAKSKKPKARKHDESPTLDQLINSSLVLSSKNKNKLNKSNKNTKPRAIKIQL